ncbi:hypothetical protein AB0I10_05480 [Streptomyces sp. NPDC050636]|uniref:hypothetical protein n=1 Tax=Streptomyces sp. NPDC050636 TaxID=3154510 RepID=UPI00343AE213
MRKLRKAAVVVAALGSVALLGAGTAYADGHGGHGKNSGFEIDIKQSASCTSHDTNVDILGEVGIANGLGGNLLGGEGSPGAQSTHLGSTMGCTNSALSK